MATGDDALAAGMDILDPATDLVKDGADEINKSRDYIAQRTSAVTPVNKGGTGSTTASGARTNLGAAASSHTHNASDVNAGTLADARIPNLNASKVTAGTFADGRIPNLNASKITAGTLPIARGGTGGASASAARAALDVVANDDVAPSGVATNNKIPRYNGDGLLVSNTPVSGAHVATKSYADGKLSLSGGTVTGHIYVPNSSSASSGYVVAYINGDGRISKGASSARYKKLINREPELPDVAAVPIASYVMKDDPDEAVRYGPIAEDLAGNEDTAGFVVYDAEGRPESFDMISYLFARLAAAEARIAALEAQAWVG